MVKLNSNQDFFTYDQKDEELVSQKQRLIIEDIISKLFQEDSSLYYAVTSDIVRHVYDKIQKRVSLNQNELELVGELTPKEIMNLISFNTKCC